MLKALKYIGIGFLVIVGINVIIDLAAIVYLAIAFEQIGL